MIESILQTELSNSEFIYLYLHQGLWKAYGRSAQRLSLLMKNKGKHTVENFAPHHPCLDIFFLTTESLIDSCLIDTCHTVEDYKLVFNSHCPDTSNTTPSDKLMGCADCLSYK